MGIAPIDRRSAPQVRRSWDEQAVHAALAACATRAEFKSRYQGAFQWLKRRGRLDVMRATIPPAYTRWTPETARAEALRYASRTDMQNHSAGAYRFLEARGMLDEVLPSRAPARPARDQRTAPPVTLPAPPWAVSCPVCGGLCPPDRVYWWQGARYCGSDGCLLELRLSG